MFDIIVHAHKKALAAAECQLTFEARAAIDAAVEDIETRIDQIVVAMGTWIVTGEDVEVGYHDEYGYELLSDVVTNIDYGFWDLRLPDGDKAKLRALGNFLDYLLAHNISVEYVKVGDNNESDTLRAADV